jgi:tetratricopeptide (TPR) repeat protein
MAYSSLAEENALRGDDPVEFLEAAIADYTQALKYDPGIAVDYNFAVAVHGRANAHLALAIHAAGQGKDATALYEKGLADIFNSLHFKVWHPSPRKQLPHVLLQLGRYQAERGRSAKTYWDAWFERVENAAKTRPEPWRWTAHLDRALVLEFFQRFEEASEAFKQAQAGHARCRRETKKKYVTPHSTQTLGDWAEAAAKSAAKPEWLRNLVRGDLYFQMGDLEASASAFGAGLKQAKEADAAGNRKNAATLVSAHFRLAGLLATLSTGKRFVKSKPAETEPPGAEAQRKEGVRHLAKALELGYRDFDRISRDRDLDPLRKHPDFKALMKKWGR